MSKRRPPEVDKGQANLFDRSPSEKGFIESFNARLRDELLDGEVFYTLREAKVVIESWPRHYNTERPNGSLGYKPPAPEAFIPAFAARGSGACVQDAYHLADALGGLQTGARQDDDRRFLRTDHASPKQAPPSKEVRPRWPRDRRSRI